MQVSGRAAAGAIVSLVIKTCGFFMAIRAGNGHIDVNHHICKFQILSFPF